MAKRDVKVSKAQAVRDYLKANPGAMPVAVAAALKEQGIEVSPRVVSVIKWQLSSKKKSKRGGKPKSAARGEKRASISADDLVAMKQLADKLGGLDAAARAIDVLQKLT